MTTLERDLANRIRDKQRQWIVDCFDLYEMAGLSAPTAASAVTSQLFNALASMLAAADKPDLDEFGRILKLEIERLRKVKKRRKGEQ